MILVKIGVIQFGHMENSKGRLTRYNTLNYVALQKAGIAKCLNLINNNNRKKCSYYDVFL